MFRPDGVYVAMLTAFDKYGSIHDEEMRRIVEFQIGLGVQGLFPVSSVGEAVHLTREEKIRLMEVVVSQNRGRVKVIPGAGSTHPSEVIYLAHAAQDLGCDGIVVAPPYYYTLSSDMVEKYFETVAKAVQIPIILYNIPLFTQPLNYEMVGRLARFENVVGLKDSSGSMVDLAHFMDSVMRLGHDLNFMTGREELLFASLMMGGKGCMTASAGIVPEVMLKVYDCWSKGDYEGAWKFQSSIFPLVRAMFSLSFPLGFKTAMEARGFQMGPSKHPLSDAESKKYLSMKPQIESLLKSVLESLGG